MKKGFIGVAIAAAMSALHSTPQPRYRPVDVPITNWDLPLRYRRPGVPSSQNGNGRISGVRAAKRMARKRRNQQREKGRK